MHTDIVITDANRSDAPALSALSVKTFTETFGPQNRKEDMDKYMAAEMNETKLADEISDTNNYFFLARYEGTLTGYAKLRVNNSEPKELAYRKRLEIERIYVDKDHHGKKIGAALMQHCIDRARKDGCDVLWLGVWEHNHKAVNFYRQWGFELFGAHEFILGDDVQTDVLMKKELG